MSFSKGDLLTFIRQGSRPGEWWGYRDADKRDAVTLPPLKFFAANFVSADIVQALFPFSPRAPHELEFSKGDIIQVSRRWNDGWWEGWIRRSEMQGDDKKGLFPSNYTVSNRLTLDGVTEHALFCSRCFNILEHKVVPERCPFCLQQNELTERMLSLMSEWVRTGGGAERLDLFQGIELYINST